MQEYCYQSKEGDVRDMYFAGGLRTQSKESNNHAVIYTRVSTKEQAENNLSLDTQKKYCQDKSHQRNSGG